MWGEQIAEVRHAWDSVSEWLWILSIFATLEILYKIAFHHIPKTAKVIESKVSNMDSFTKGVGVFFMCAVGILCLLGGIASIIRSVNPPPVQVFVDANGRPVQPRLPNEPRVYPNDRYIPNPYYVEPTPNNRPRYPNGSLDNGSLGTKGSKIDEPKGSKVELPKPAEVK